MWNIWHLHTLMLVLCGNHIFDADDGLRVHLEELAAQGYVLERGPLDKNRFAYYATEKGSELAYQALGGMNDGSG
jgi:hypothetical protein